MNLIRISADLSVRSNHNDLIELKNDDGTLIIHYTGKSVPYLPFAWIKTGLKFLKNSNRVAHPIKIYINQKEFYSISSTEKSIKNYRLGFSIFFKSLFG
jgi:hypothetical protein